MYRGITGKEPGQQFHIDSRIPCPSHPLGLVAVWTLTDFTKTNGATRFIPKSHLFGKYPPPDHSSTDEFIVECPAGSLILFNASLWHGSSDKFDSELRSAIFITYARWFMRPNYKINRSIPESIRSRLTEKMTSLSGAYFEEPKDEFERKTRMAEYPQW